MNSQLEPPATTCPRCSEQVAPANLRCRSCGLPRSEFASIESQSSAQTDSRTDFELGRRPGTSSQWSLSSEPPAPAPRDSTLDLGAQPAEVETIGSSTTARAVAKSIGDLRPGAGSDDAVTSDTSQIGSNRSSATRSVLQISCEHCGTINPVPRSLLQSGVGCSRCGRPVVESSGSSTSASGSISKIDSKIVATVGKDRRKHLKRAVQRSLEEFGSPAAKPKFGKPLSRGDAKQAVVTLEAVSGEASPSPLEIAAAREILESLASQADDRIVEHLLKNCETLHDDVRGVAKYTLGALQVPEAFPMLVNALIDDVPATHPDVLRGLGAFANRAAVRPVVTVATFWEEHIEAANDALAKLGPRAIPSLVQLLERKDKRYLYPSIVRALGELKDPQTIAPLANILKGDRRPEVRQLAAKSLGAIDDRSVLSPLVESLKDKDDGVRIAASEALQAHPRKRIVPALVHVLSDSNPVVRANAARLIGKIGIAKAIPPLSLLTSDPEPQTRVAVLQALGELGDETAAPQLGYELGEACKAGDEELASSVAAAMGTLKDPRSTLPLLNAIPPRRPATQVGLINALGHIGDASILPALVDLMTTGATPAVQVAAVKSLGKLGGEDAIEPLKKAIQAGPPMKPAAVMALGDVHSEKSVEVLSEQLRDETAEIRRLAVLSLQQIGDEVVVRHLRPMKNDADPRVAEAAVEALKSFGIVEQVEPEKKSKKQKAAKVKVRQKKQKKSWNLPSFNLETLQSLTPADLKLLAAEYKALTAVLAVLVVAAGVGLFFGKSLMRNTFTGGLNPEIIVRGPLSGIAVSPSGERIAMSRGLGVLDVYDTTAKTVVIDERGPAAESVRFGATENVVFSATAEKAGRWDIKAKSFVDAKPIGLGAYNADWSKIVTYASGALVTVNLADGSTEKLADVAPPFPGAVALAIAATPDLGRVLIGFKDGVVLIWSAETGNASAMRTGYDRSVSALAVSESGDHLAVGFNGGEVAVWKAGESQPIATVSPDRVDEVKQLAFAGSDQLGIYLRSNVKVVKVADGQVVQEFRPKVGRYDMVSVNRDGTRAAFAADEGKKVALHNMTDGSLVELIDVPNL